MLAFLARFAACLIAAILGWIMICGMTGVSHGMASRLYIALAFLMIPVLTLYSARRTWIALTIDSVLGIAYLGIALLAALTGYLPDDNGGFASEETRNRFVILHQVFLPSAAHVTLTALGMANVAAKLENRKWR